jgi:type IV secretory pathway protease TraF
MGGGFDNTAIGYDYAAGKYANIDTLRAAHDLGMRFAEYTMHGAAHCNDLAVLKFLYYQQCPSTTAVCHAAAKRGYLEMLQWAVESQMPWHRLLLPREAAASGNVEVAAWVLQLDGVRLDARVMHAAAEREHRTMCEYLHTQQCPWDASSCNAAAERGHLTTLRYLIEHGCPYTPQVVCLMAAGGGCVEVLQYLQSAGALQGEALLKRALNVPCTTS